MRCLPLFLKHRFQPSRRSPKTCARHLNESLLYVRSLAQDSAQMLHVIDCAKKKDTRQGPS